MKKIRKILALILALSMLTACGGQKNGEVDGKTNLSVGCWPAETAIDREPMDKMKDEFMEKYTDINIIPDTYVYDTKTFIMKGAGKQLPDLMPTYFTEAEMLMSGGYAADITEVMQEYGYDKTINPKLMDIVTKDGKIYGIPTSAYAQGLFINKKLFVDAGLVNADGTIMVPETYEEVAEFSKIIKEKTGAAGFVMPTVDNCGGWHFINIAWSYGVEFVKQREDGTWEATFDTPEAREALQFVKDLKWEYDAFVSDTVIDIPTMQQYFGTHQAAMMIANPPQPVLSQKYGMEINDIFVTRMPAGPKGRYSQMGGEIWFFADGVTKEQIKAGMEWLGWRAQTPKLTDESLENLRKNLEIARQENSIILDQDAFDVWVDKEILEKTRGIRKEFSNVLPENYEQYYSFEDVTINPEPAACAQQLYAVLDGCIQEVLTNENADVDTLISKACNDFQVNHLDKM